MFIQILKNVMPFYLVCYILFLLRLPHIYLTFGDPKINTISDETAYRSQRQLNLARACYTWGKKSRVEYLLKSISQNFSLQSTAAHIEIFFFGTVTY